VGETRVKRRGWEGGVLYLGEMAAAARAKLGAAGSQGEGGRKRKPNEDWTVVSTTYGCGKQIDPQGADSVGGSGIAGG